MSFPDHIPADKIAGDAFGQSLAFALAVAPLVIIIAPRFAAFLVPLLALVFFAAFLVINKRLPAFSRPVFVAPLGIIALMGLSSLWSVDASATLEQTLKTAPVFLSTAALFSLAQTLGEKHIDLLVRIFPMALMCGGALCVLDLYGSGIIYHLLNGHEERFNSSKPNRSVIIFFLFSMLALPMLLRCREFCTLRQAAFLFAIILALLYKTDSQAAQLGLIAAVMLYFFFPYAQAWAWKFAAGGIVFIFFTAPFVAQWMFHSLTNYAAHTGWLMTGYAAHRMEIWDFISRRALERPLSGFGAETTASMRDFDSAMLYHPHPYVLHPHNFILQLWIEFGIGGAAAAAMFFVLLLRFVSSHTPEQARLVLPLFGAVFLMGAVTYGLWQGWWIGLLGLLMIYGSLTLRAGGFSCTK